MKALFNNISFKTAMLCLLAAMMTFSSEAQQRPVISQYMLNGLVLNPAYAGRHEYSNFSALYRDQWVNVPGAPVTGTFTGQTGFKDRNLGVGLMLTNDRVGAHNDVSIYGSYAYNVRLTDYSKLAFGLQAGVDNIRTDFSKVNLRPGEEDDPYLTGVRNLFFPNFGLGMFYHSDKMYIGFSVPYLLSNKKLKEDDFYEEIHHSRNYYLTGGMLVDINPRLKLKPSILMRIEDNMPFAVDLNANIYIDEIFGLGASYRQGDSVIGIFEFQMNKYLKFSYAYDWILSNLTQFTRGSHELMLQYRINFNAPRKHRMCPGPLYF